MCLLSSRFSCLRSAARWDWARDLYKRQKSDKWELEDFLVFDKSVTYGYLGCSVVVSELSQPQRG